MAKDRKPKDPGEKPKTKLPVKAPLDKEALQKKIRAQMQAVFGYEDSDRAKRRGNKSD